MDPAVARKRLLDERARQHPAEVGTETFERERHATILEMLESQLAEVDYALRRLDEGSYGDLRGLRAANRRGSPGGSPGRAVLRAGSGPHGARSPAALSAAVSAPVPRVVVVGAGFGGLAAVRALRQAPVRTVLIDQHNYHLFTPLLYQVGSALLDPSAIAYPIRSILRRIPNAEFRLGRITGIDLDGRRLETDHGPVAYDYLVLATGSVNNYFGNRSLEERSFALKELGQALALRNQVLSQFERAAWSTDAAARKALLTFVVVGGGPTGVEYAGALSELVRQVLRKDFPHMDISQVEIQLVEATGSLLSAFAPDLQAAALRMVTRKGIQVLLSAPVAEVSEGMVRLQDGRELMAGTVIWTAGVQASDIGASLQRERGRAGRVRVEPTLQFPGHPEAFVIGDLAEVVGDGAPLPMLAPVAIQAGQAAAANIRAQVLGQPARAFRYRDKGIMATIGRHAAVAQIGPIHLHGFPGWVTWLVVHLVLLIGFRNRIVVLANWAWEYFLFDRPVRLIARAQGPPADRR